METSRIRHIFFQHLPEFLRKRLSHQGRHSSQNWSSQLSIFASTTNIPHPGEEHLIYDTDGCLLFMQSAQSNLSLFNVSCDSLIFLDNDDELPLQSRRTLNTNKHYNSFTDIHAEIKKFTHRSTMFFSDDLCSSPSNTLQRWKGLELLNLNA